MTTTQSAATIAIASGLTTLGYAYYLYKQATEHVADDLVVKTEECDEELCGDAAVVSKYRHFARSQVGLVNDTPVNRLMLSDIIRKQMRADNMRNADISKYLQYCIELALTPTRHEITARRMGASRVVREAKRDYAHPVLSFTQWLWGLGAAKLAA